VQVSTAGGSEPRWSPDGAEIFYMSLDAELMAASPRLTEDGLPRVSAPSTLFRVPLVRTGVVALAQYDVARDGRFLINVNVQSDSAEPISLLLNWRPPRD
jgi:hypothetical protein